MPDDLARLLAENEVLRQRLARAEAAERRFRDMVDNSVEGFYQATPDGHYLYVNKALARMYGYSSPEELMSVPAQQVYADPSRLQELRAVLDASDEVHGFEAQRLRRDGSVIWCSANIRVIRGPDGKRLYSEGIVEDITERKLAELSLQAERQGLQDMIQGSPVGVLVADAATRRVLLANRELQRLSGVALQPGDSVDRYLGLFERLRPDGSLYLPDQLPIARALRFGETVRSEPMRWRFSGGREVAIVAGATPIVGEDGRITGAIAMVQEDRLAPVLPHPLPPAAGPSAMPSAVGVRVGTATDAGRRERNEDAWYAAPDPDRARAGSGWLCAVADGMGGAVAGEEASRIAVEALGEAFGSSSGGGAGLAQAVQRAAAAVHHAAQRPGRSGMGTTLTAAVLESSRLTVLHAGDCRVYRLRAGVLTQLTVDHTWVAELVRAGAMTQAQAQTFAYRHVVTRALGRSPEVQFDRVEAEALPGDRLLLCCDGLYKTVPDERIAEVLARLDPQAAAGALVRLANDSGGDDNVTAVVVAL
jgi:protein phosphatase